MKLKQIGKNKELPLLQDLSKFTQVYSVKLNIESNFSDTLIYFFSTEMTPRLDEKTAKSFGTKVK